MNLNKLIQESSAGTPDPERALKNLDRLLIDFPDFLEEHKKEIVHIAALFSYSQFLAEYTIRNPLCLSRALKDYRSSINKQAILAEAFDKYESFRHEELPAIYKEKAMRLLREIKKDYLLLITLRDISGVTTLNECMTELTILSEALLELALDMSSTIMRRKFGLLRENAFSIIGMGKLGAEELNYSSDIDIIAVYRSEESLSTGVLNPFGIRHSKISSQEYFCTLTEILMNLLQSPTEDGIAYRTDLRLRPNGQKGSLALSLYSYRSYYEAWGKTWERVALIRARPVAGDNSLGAMFIDAVEPFVWKRSMDYHDIEEIRELKKKIDTIFDTNDIKRGYGGIREIEFFVQTFQLLYGGEMKNLRRLNLSASLQELLREGFLSEEDVKILSESYSFLRRIEHLLQMKDDLQTHSLPSNSDELFILAKKMNFHNENDFLSDLRLKRLKVRDMYNSLLGGTEFSQEVMLSLRDDMPEESILDYLSFKGFLNPGAALKNMDSLSEQMSTGKTIRERTLLRKIIPAFLEHAVKSVNKDKILGILVSFIRKIGSHESYMDLLLQRPDTREITVSIFSMSTYLTRSLLSLDNIEGIFEYPDIRMDYNFLQERLVTLLSSSSGPLDAIREIKTIEELKSGMLYLDKTFDAHQFSASLCSLAETVVKAISSRLNMDNKFAVIGLGAFGSGELNIDSDLDLMFIHTNDRNLSAPAKGSAEELIRFLSAYTAQGFAYKVDTRLRPDGSKGTLANDLSGYKRYYLKSAQPWEIQSLLRARPIAGNMDIIKTFQQIKRQVILERCNEIRGSDMQHMRGRVIREVSRETSGYDIKNGPGSIKEIEFLVQYLQLKHVREVPDLIIQNTETAIRQLNKNSVLDSVPSDLLSDAYTFFRTVDTMLRLNDENVLKINSEIIDIIIRFLNLASKDDLINKIKDTRQKVLEITKKFYG
jgi:[glutamine synthetase] adenylyltransferase / [glutamine synthetase]-adenylyl-L-tyrosine phosphorylase